MDKQLGINQQGLPYLPCATIAVKEDSDFTILHANEAFFELIGYSSDEVQYRFANKFSALIDAKTTKLLREVIKRNSNQQFVIEYRIKNNTAKDIWIYSLVDFSRIHTEHTLYIMSHEISSHKKTELDLLRIRKKTTLLLQSSSLGLLDYDKMTGTILGITTKELFTNNIQAGDIFPDCFLDENIVHPDYVDTFLACCARIRHGEHSSFVELQLGSINEEYKWFTLSFHKEVYDGRSVVTVVINNITAEKEATLSYLNEALFYQAILNSQDAYGHVDITADCIFRVGGLWNPYNEWINEISYTALFQKFIYKIVHIQDRAQYSELLSCKNLVQAYQNGITHLSCEFRRIVEQNKMVWMRITLELFEHPVTHHLMLMLYLKNIDAQKKQRTVLEYEAGHDTLTNLYNKSGAIALIKEYKNLMREDEHCALIRSNIDDFRAFNNLHGYEMGDQILLQVSKILGNAFRKHDIISRVGGDDFLIFLKNIYDTESVENRLKAVFRCLETELVEPVTISMGIAYMDSIDDFQHTLTKSELALQNAKQTGKNRYCTCAHDHKITDSDILAQSANDAATDAITSDFSVIVDCMSEFEAYLGKYNEMAYLIDPKTFALISGNQAFYDRMGLTEAECTGVKCYKLIHHRSHPCPFCGFSSWATDRFHMYRNYNEVLEQEFLIKNKLIQWHNQEVLFTIAVDLSNDKNLIEVMENTVTEDHAILSGIQKMQSAPNLSFVMESALESIAKFFRAPLAQVWVLNPETKSYLNQYQWTEKNSTLFAAELDAIEIDQINNWLQNRKWIDKYIVDNKETMLCSSYELYRRMEKYNFFNQNWFLLKNEEGSEIGIIEIDNISTHFQGHAFLRSFSTFIANEWEKRKTVDALIRSGFHDRLTGLLNRASYEQFIAEFSETEMPSIGVIFININGLKKINESLGFPTGNNYIVQLSQVLEQTFLNSYKYRLSGDEFLIILPNVEQIEVEQGISNLQDTLSDLKLFSISIGYAWDNVEKDPETLVEYATQNMKINKARYHSSLEIEDNERVELLDWTTNAIQDGKFLVYLQPKFDIRTDTVMGAEALIRYVDKQNNIVPPARFIPALEKNNLIRYVDFFVLEESCRVLQSWQEKGINIPRISINFSRITMSENDLITSMDRIISKYGINKNTIEIEITESFGDLGKALLNRAAKSLHLAGYSISLDDFGAKYTNLAMLSDIDAQVLKIDKSLVHSIVKDERSLLILKNVIQMCKDLDIEIIAEGVETPQQRELLGKLNCYYIQGFLYSKPISIAEFEEKYF